MVRERTPARTPSWDEVRPHLDLALASLPVPHRQAAVLHYFYGKTQAEIAREVGCSQPIVAKRLSRALDALRRKLLRRGLPVPAAALVFFLGG